MVRSVIHLIVRFRQSDSYLVWKWGLMSAALFWMLVYVWSQSAEKLPGFVYVNF
jgi:hypothetical protein